MKLFKHHNITLSKALLLFYIVVAGNFTKNLFSGQLKDFLEQRWAQHTVGFITMLIIVMEFAGISKPTSAIAYSIMAYGWFILTTKLDLHWNFAIIGLLIFGYLYEYKMDKKEIATKNDPVLDEENREKILKKHKSTKTIIAMSIFIVTVLGTAQYLFKKKGQYGGGFDLDKFILNGRNKN